MKSPEQEYFFELLKLGKKNKNLHDENPEVFSRRLECISKIQTNLHYSKKDEYINLAKEFLDGQITADDFSYSFMAIHRAMVQELNQMVKSESVELANFLEPRRLKLRDIIIRTYHCCDFFSLDPEVALSDEKELEECAQILLVTLQKQ